MYDGNTGVTTFDIKFTEDTEITGYMKLHMWVTAEEHNDADIFVNIQKLDTKGEWLPVSVLGEPHPGTWGKMRISHRALDEEKSTHFQPIQSHLKEEKIQPGEVVPVDVELVPISRFWHKGQSLRIQIAGHYIREGWFEPLFWDTDNHGDTSLHGRQVRFLPPDPCYPAQVCGRRYSVRPERLMCFPRRTYSAKRLKAGREP